MDKQDLIGNILEKYFIPAIKSGATHVIYIIIGFLVLFAAIDLTMTLLTQVQSRSIKKLVSKVYMKLIKFGIALIILKNYFTIFFDDLYKIATVTLPTALTGIHFNSVSNIKNVLLLPFIAAIGRLSENYEEFAKNIMANGGEAKYVSAKKGFFATVGGWLKKITKIRFSDIGYATHPLAALILIFAIIIVWFIVIAFITQLIIILLVERLNIAFGLGFGILLMIGQTELQILAQYGKLFIQLIFNLLTRLFLISVILLMITGEQSTYGARTIAKRILELKGLIPLTSIFTYCLSYAILIYVSKKIYEKISTVKW